VCTKVRSKTRIAALIAAASFTVCLGATLIKGIPLTKSHPDSRELGGRWLITLAIPDQEPLQLLAEFSNSGAAEHAQDIWKRVSPGQYAVAFVVPSGEVGAGFTYRVSGTLRLDQSGLLRGCLSADTVGGSGQPVAHLRGAAKARRIAAAP
jgi:hypothetical protein